MEINRLQEAQISRWKGGGTRELYRDQDDFGLRISCAEIDPGKAPFSDFTGYERILRILEGSVQIERKRETIRISEGQELRFSGSEKIESSNTARVLDFNVIYCPKLYHVEFSKSTGKQKYLSDHGLIFALEATVVAVEKEWTLNKYDYLRIDSSRYDVQGNCLVVRWGNIRKLEAP